MHPVQKAAQDWEADAIEKCRNDPAVTAAGLCYVCMCDHPCLCDWSRTLSKMRTFYEANRRIEGCSPWTGKTTLSRAEPVLNMSWGQKGDGLMDGLYKIATAPYKTEIDRLRKELRQRGSSA